MRSLNLTFPALFTFICRRWQVSLCSHSADIIWNARTKLIFNIDEPIVDSLPYFARSPTLVRNLRHLLASHLLHISDNEIDRAHAKVSSLFSNIPPASSNLTILLLESVPKPAETLNQLLTSGISSLRALHVEYNPKRLEISEFYNDISIDKFHKLSPKLECLYILPSEMDREYQCEPPSKQLIEAIADQLPQLKCLGIQIPGMHLLTYL